jgi:purine nucleosidase/pyrimidine-specific ribonucleoside hydrolase
MCGRVATPCILDCDPGHDDAVAILLAAAHPAIDLLAVTTVAGNGPLDKVTLNARRVLTLAGIRDVPIAAGAAGPLSGDLDVAIDVHGASALDGPSLPDPEMDVDPRPAAELIEGVLRSASEPVAIVATGPLTNVATVLEAAPDVAPRIREIIWMGGSTERGNRTPYAEFNAFVDPDAVARVLASGVPTTMVGLNLTHQALATPAVVERIRVLGTSLARTTAEWLEFFGGTYRRIWGFEAPPLHDPCAVALVVEPGIIRCVDAFVAVETDGRWTRGATAVDLSFRWKRIPNARVAMDLDVERFWDLVVDAIDTLGARDP